MQYDLDRRTTASHARNWHSFYIHTLDLIFLQQPQGTCLTLQRFTQGLSLGSILAPLRFLFYMASLLNDDEAIALFADDVSILTTAHKKEDAEAAAHSVVNFVVIWSQEWKLNLNTDKSEVCPFSTSSNNNTWNLTIFIGTQKICINTTLCLLGIILDRSLTFNAHLKKLCRYYLVFPLSQPQHILLGVGTILL